LHGSFPAKDCRDGVFDLQDWVESEGEFRIVSFSANISDLEAMLAAS